MRMANKTKTSIAPSRELQTHEQNRENPAEDDLHCHIASGDRRTAYCGCLVEDSPTCQTYDGEGVCPSCGLATCPTCATMSELHWELVKDDGDDS